MNKVVKWSVILVCILLAILWRFADSHYFFSNINGHYNFLGSDCYYHLRRLVAFLGSPSKTLVFDPLADWPQGSQVDWPEGLLWSVGIPLKILGIHSFHALELGASLIMILMGLACIFINYFLAEKIFKNFWLSAFVLFLTATNFLLIRFSCLGELGHHILEAFFPPLFLFLSFKVFEEKKIRWAFILGIVLSYSLLISSSSLFPIFSFFLCYALVIGRAQNLGEFLVVATVFFISLLIVAGWEYTHRKDFFSITYPSGFHLILAALMISFSVLAVYFKRQLLTLFIGAICLLSVFYWLNWPKVLIADLKMAFAYVFEREGPLQNISEALPLFRDANGFQTTFVHANFGYLIYLLPLIWLQIFRFKKIDIKERALILMVTVLSVPAFAQKRFAHLFVCLFLVSIVWLFKKASARLSKAPQVVLAAAAASFTVLPFLAEKVSFSGSSRLAFDNRISAAFLESTKISPEDAWARLTGSAPVHEGIWLDPNLGHLMEYVTGFGVTGDVYFHDLQKDFRWRTITSGDELREVLIENKIRYAVLADNWKLLELGYQWNHFPTDSIVTRRDGQTDYHLTELQKYAWVRLVTEDHPVEGFNLMFNLDSRESTFYHFVKVYQVQE